MQDQDYTGIKLHNIDIMLKALLQQAENADLLTVTKWAPARNSEGADRIDFFNEHLKMRAMVLYHEQWWMIPAELAAAAKEACTKMKSRKTSTVEKDDVLESGLLNDLPDPITFARYKTVSADGKEQWRPTGVIKTARKPQTQQAPTSQAIAPERPQHRQPLLVPEPPMQAVQPARQATEKPEIKPTVQAHVQAAVKAATQVAPSEPKTDMPPILPRMSAEMENPELASRSGALEWAVKYGVFADQTVALEVYDGCKAAWKPTDAASMFEKWIEHVKLTAQVNAMCDWAENFGAYSSVTAAQEQFAKFIVGDWSGKHTNEMMALWIAHCRKLRKQTDLLKMGPPRS